jgi:DNA-binding MarR family transcriptional regulator
MPSVRSLTQARPSAKNACGYATIVEMQAIAAHRNAPDVSPEAAETALRLGAFFRYFFAFDRGSHLRAMEESGLSLAQCKALFVLAGSAEHAGVSGRELAESIGLSGAAISRAVDGLVEGRHVTRIEDPHDRRVRLIAITDEGRRAVDRIVAARMEGMRAFAAGLTADERRALDRALDKLLARDELAEIYSQIKELEER